MIVLIIGGTGTLGKQVTSILLRNPQIERLRILSRGEHSQMEMQEFYNQGSDGARLDFFVGDVRDRDRIREASKDCNHVYHFAAMKSVDKAEYDPWEAVLTNIEGTKNVIEACKENKVKKAIFTSTDKAVAPLNIYGASKLVAEKLFIQANIGRHETSFGVCRYGNVLGSNGSVFAKWRKRMESGQKIPLTHEEMTRFFILPERAAEFVTTSLEQMKGGEIFIPQMKSTTMINLARAFMELHGKDFHMANADWIGIRPGEKMHEVLISEDEKECITHQDDRFIRWPEKNLFPVKRRGRAWTKSFTSYTAERFTSSELKELIRCQLELLEK